MLEVLPLPGDIVAGEKRDIDSLREVEVSADAREEVALCFDRSYIAVDLRARIDKQLEQIRQHAVVTELCFISHDLAQRQHLRLVVPGDVVRPSIDLVSCARFRPDVYGPLGKPIDRLHVLLSSFADPGLSEIEDRDLELCFEAAPRPGLEFLDGRTPAS